MFNLPNNTPYALIIESDNGYLLMTCRWTSQKGGEMGPTNTFEVHETRLDALAAVEKFMSQKNPKK